VLEQKLTITKPAEWPLLAILHVHYRPLDFLYIPSKHRCLPLGLDARYSELVATDSGDFLWSKSNHLLEPSYEAPQANQHKDHQQPLLAFVRPASSPHLICWLPKRSRWSQEMAWFNHLSSWWLFSHCCVFCWQKSAHSWFACLDVLDALAQFIPTACQ